MTDFKVGFWRKRAVKAALDRGDDRRHAWGGHRIVKFAGDCLAMQQLLVRCRPQVLVEIGTQYGGSTLFFATIAPLAGIEAIVSLDIADLPGRPADPMITYLTGDSAAPEVFARVKALVGTRSCSVVVDGNHHAEQVDKELELYAPLVTAGQALVMEDTLVDVLDFRKFRAAGGPLRSIAKYMPRHPEFEIAEGIEPYVTTNFFGYWVKKKTGLKYSLVVPYFRTPEITRMCLYSIFKFARGTPEVIVVDNAPGSAESAMLGEFDRIRVLPNPTALRGSDANFEALDLGLDAAKHDHVGLIHSDTLFLREGWDEACFSRLEREGLAALGTQEREANPFRPLRQRVRDWVNHARHRPRPDAGSAGKLMVHFLLTRKSTLARTGFGFRRDRDILVSTFAATGQPVGLLSLVEVSRLIWHTSNITSLLTGQITDPKLLGIYQEKRRRLLAEPRIREAFGPVLPKG